MKQPKKQAVVPTTEFSDLFVQGMYDRMAVSFFKYGPIAKGFPSPMDALGSLRLHLEKYATDGNTEHLIDAANYCMIEFLRPAHPKAHFTPTDSNGSPGRRKISGVITTKGNLDVLP